ncbi:DMT family transporter [Singulisphaera sp. PoT]|uniref:DMT family transporter n=1 Tax=Singulisphaera sp. PoT TaxID=3411797 RepID=UPI003BF5A131
MSAWVVGLVLFSAVLHAAWNGLLKGGGDRLRLATIMVLTSGIASIPLILALPWPRSSSWFYILASACVHVAYNVLLVASYRDSDLGVAYPIARGSSPMLVTLGASLVAGERLDASALAGVGLISLGILALARESRAHLSARALIPALLTGVAIAAYTVVDGLGARLSGDSRSYAAWLFLVYGVLMFAFMLMHRDGLPSLRVDAEALRAGLGGLISMVAYAVVIWAASISPMGEVSALRETSVVFAAVIGWLFLGERLGSRRLAACIVVALGAAVLGYQRH